MTKLKYPKNISAEQKLHIQSALGSSALEGLDNIKIQQKVINDIASGKTLEQKIQEIKQAIAKDAVTYAKQFD